MIMVMIHATGIVLPVLAGYSSVPLTAYSMALSYIALAGWLIAKGFEGNYRADEAANATTGRSLETVS